MFHHSLKVDYKNFKQMFLLISSQFDSLLIWVNVGQG